MADHSDETPDAASAFTRRSILLGAAQAAGFSILGWRMFDLQVLGARKYAPLADENRINLQALAPQRGRILDALGRMLADNDELFRVTITPSLAKNVAAILERVRHIIPLTDDEITQLAARAKKQGRNTATTIASNLTFEQVAKLNLYAPNLPGIKTDFSWRRRYHDGAAMSHVVGVVGSVNRFSIDDDAVARLPETRVGKSGAELAFDSVLRGVGGTQKSEVDARGRIVRNLETVEPVAGTDITLTVDAELQRRVVERMQGERRAAAVVLDISAGDIIVMASVPGFDARDIAGGISDADWTKLSNSDDKPLLNRAIAGRYAPGSTFLIVTALAALDAGVVSPDERIVCTGKYDYGGETYRCSNPAGHGSVTLHDAIRSSCEVFFCEMSVRLGIDRVAKAARTMGFGAMSGIGFSEETPGVVPDPDWKRGNLNAGWLGGETLLTGIGRGFTQVTPLQLAVMAARVAGGRSVTPCVRRDSNPQPFDDLAFDPEHCALVRRAMVAAVNDVGGSAEAARQGEGKPRIAGKSGIAEMFARAAGTPYASLEWAKRSHALFVGYQPADAPRYAIATVVEHGGSGDVAARLAGDILTLTADRDAASHSQSGDVHDVAPSQSRKMSEDG